MSDTYIADDFAEAAQYPSLGPAYFANRRFVAALLADADKEPHALAPVIDKCASDLADALRDKLETHLLSDAEYNVQHEIRRQVEGTIHALLTGLPWALSQYVLASNYDAALMRAAIIEHAGAEIVRKARPGGPDERERVRVTSVTSATADNSHAMTVALYRKWHRA